MEPWHLALAGAVLLLFLTFKLRGPSGGPDLTGPPKRRGRAFTPAEAAQIGELVAGGERAEALRLLRAAGHEEPDALRLVALVERLTAGSGEAREPGRIVRPGGEDGLA